MKTKTYANFFYRNASTANIFSKSLTADVQVTKT